MASYLAERYVPPSARASLTADAERLSGAADDSTRLQMTIYAPGEETCFYLFDSGSAARVERASRKAGIRMDRIMPVVSLPASDGARPAR